MALEANATRLFASHHDFAFEHVIADVFEADAVLEQLAAATGGRYWEPQALDGLPEAVRASPAGIVQQEVLPLWDAPALFLLLIALKVAEWLLRRLWSVV